MPFNSRSYHRNKERRNAMDYLAEARLWKQQLVTGKLDFPSTPERVKERIVSRVKLARLHWKTYLGHLRMERCDADLKRFQHGEITYAEFMSKWDIRGKTK